MLLSGRQQAVGSSLSRPAGRSQARDSEVYALAVSGVGSSAGWGGCGDGLLRLWDIGASGGGGGGPVTEWRGSQTGGVHCLAADAAVVGGDRLGDGCCWTGGADGTVRLFDKRMSVAAAKHSLHRDTVTALQVSSAF